jgi:TonB-dependent SusC/RagA subfamily outer membrane receptor
MKKNSLMLERNWHKFLSNKTIRTMKLSICLFLFTVLQALAIDTYSQNTKLTLDLKNVTLEDALRFIENQSEFYFLYSQKMVDVSRKIDIDVTDKNVDYVLSHMFTGTGIDYIVKDRQIVLSTNEMIQPFKKKSVQQIIVTGKVTDEDGNPLPGVNIIVKGTITGTITDLDGNYSIEADDPEDVLVFTFIGMLTQEIKVGNQTEIIVTLVPDLIGLEEVVAVGYGVQRKVNLTGSVSTMESEDLLKRPVINAGSLLQGRVAGLNITQHSGQPGQEEFIINIRGIGSFSNSNPYILVDGFESNFDEINPNDVENISVLKDAASAAIYGSRAANGVILITTKKGKKDFISLEAHGEMSVQTPTRLPDYIYNSVEYMEMWNKSAEHSDIVIRYPQELIDAYRNAAPGDPQYPNFNWMDYIYKPALRQDYQLSVTGGG